MIARMQAAAGDATTARKTFTQAIHDAGLSVEDPPKPNPDIAKSPGVRQNMPAAERAKLAEIQAMSGDLAGALKTVRSIDDPNYVRSALQRVIAARATAGDVAGAFRLCLSETKTPDERRSALEGLAEGVDARFTLKSLEPSAR